LIYGIVGQCCYQLAARIKEKKIKGPNPLLSAKGSRREEGGSQPDTHRLTPNSSRERGGSEREGSRSQRFGAPTPGDRHHRGLTCRTLVTRRRATSAPKEREAAAEQRNGPNPHRANLNQTLKRIL